MKRIIFIIFLTITFFVLQGTLFGTISFGNIHPNLLLILAVSLGLMGGKRTGMLVGFFSGLMMDIFMGSYIGFYSLLLMYTGYISGTFNRIFYPEDIKLPMIMIALSDLIYGFFCYCFLFLLRGKLDIGYYFFHICIPECVYTLVVTIIAYPLILGLYNLLSSKPGKKGTEVDR